MFRQVSQIAESRSCYARFANISFAKFRKYFFRTLTFVSQDSQGFANTSVSRFRYSQFSKNSQIGFSFRKFRKVFAMGSNRQLSSSLLMKFKVTKALLLAEETGDLIHCKLVVTWRSGPGTSHDSDELCRRVHSGRSTQQASFGRWHWH